jgi:hypothetical protein
MSKKIEGLIARCGAKRANTEIECDFHRLQVVSKEAI